ncbi:hypothetical protein Q4R47_20185, partial [Morganella morganii]
LGLSLTPADFLRVVRYPKPVLVGLVCQIVLLPLACFLIVQGFALEAALAVGMMLLAASPGGTTANLYSHLAHGDVALNITLTAVNSVIAIHTMPLIVNLSLQYFMGDGQAIPLQFGKVVQVFVIVLGPVAIGMEIGIHNGTLAIALALSPSLLNNSTMAIPPAIYGVLMFFTAAAFGWWVSRG